ncbi:MAG TPA: hypothetical protein DDW18_02185 [Firmicutes bacterium]|nr:hypothetical protein [Bacillota bacterium]HBN00607.1 hypothetical protein [Bacillota bacterium]
MKNFFQKLADYYLHLLKNKRAGFYLCALTAVLMILQAAVYSMAPSEVFNSLGVTLSVVGIVLFVVFSFSVKQLEILAPVSLMVINFSCLVAYAKADDLLDYFSTQFFSGFSLKTLFSLPIGVWLPIILFLANFIFSSVAMYLPQSKKESEEKANRALSEGGNNQ